MIDFFLDHLTHEKRASSHTVIAYQQDLAQFSAYLATTYEVNALENATYFMIRSWIVSLVEQDLKNKSVNRKIATLRGFFSYLHKHGKIDANPMQKIKGLKTPQNLATYLEEKPMEKLLSDISFPADWTGVRDQLVVEMFYGTGIRLAELISLSVQDVDLSGRKISVTGKRNKQRIVPLTEPLSQLISRYLEEKPFDTQHFICTNTGEEAYPMFIQRLVKKYLGYVTSLQKRSPHVLRHTFATHLLNNGAELNAIKELLGHASLSATQIYTHNSIEKLRKIHEQAHPKG